MSTANSASWRRYNIFISSTFKDMDYERDVIKFRVIPALNRRFRDRRVELQAIDLRLGVNTSDMSEAESERKVLSVCTSCIDSARPFFIGLIGKRYGWIPPVERWQEFIGRLAPQEQELLAGTAGCSVTEMEIVYGALSQGSFDSSHVLFYLRDDASYEGIPAEQLPAFCDSDPDNLSRLAKLKEKVEKLFGERGGEDDRCTPYRLHYEDGHFVGDEFESIVTEQLAQQIELETARSEESGGATWWEEEKELEESTLLRLLPGSVEQSYYFDSEEEEEGDDSDKVIWYIPGLGASTNMAQEYAGWNGDEEVVRLLAVFGMSQYSSSTRPVIVRWIHELAEVSGTQDDLPEDAQLLEKIPVNNVYDILAQQVDKVRDAGKYIYIYLDEVETLETSSPKDLYMPWLDRIAEDVNIMVNLQDGSEAREKFLEAYPKIGRLSIGGMQDKKEAEELIGKYEKTYFLELPASVRQALTDCATDEDGVLAPIKVHSLFRLFESLTQEDFSIIRSRQGSQIEAINSYLQELWEDMPDTTYDIMTFMVNNILGNLGLGEEWRQAFWTLAAAPSGLRESDIAHFVGASWSDVQFYRAMNFLPDFFFEDRARHIWKAKYITLPEDGLARRQKAISEYILTLDKGDFLRETMGFYYALKSGEPSHFLHYEVEGDYIHGQQMAWLTKIYSPQIRQLAREGFFEDDEFRHYSLALDVPARLQLFIDIITGLADLTDTRKELGRRMPQLLGDVSPDSLSAPDAFAYASLIGINAETEELLEKAITAAKRSKELGFETAGRLYLLLKGKLVTAREKSGKGREAKDLLKEESGTQSTEERYASLSPLLAQAQGKMNLFGRNKALALLDEFYEKFYALPVQFSASSLMLQSFSILYQGKQHRRLLDELIRYLPTMQRFYRVDTFFSQPAALQLFFFYHFELTEAAEGLQGGTPLFTMLPKDIQALFESGAGPLQWIDALSLIQWADAASKLKEIDPDHAVVSTARSLLRENFAATVSEVLAHILGVDGLSAEEIDDKIKEKYEEYVSEKN